MPLPWPRRIFRASWAGRFGEDMAGDDGRIRRLRLLSRITAAFVLDVTAMVRGDADLTDAVLATVIIQVNTADVRNQPPLQAAYLDAPPPDSLRRPATIKAVAESLNLPFETVRRRINALAADGFCRFVEGGVIVPSEVLAEPRYAVRSDLYYARLRDFYYQLIDLGLLEALPPPAVSLPDGLVPVRPVSRLVGAFILRVVEAIAPIGEFLDGIVMLEVFRSNTAHFPNDLLGQEGFEAQDMVSDDLRAPISIAVLAKRVGAPRETVRRHVAGLLAREFLERRRTGLIVPSLTLSRAPVLPSLITASSNLNRLFSALAQQGVLELWDAERAGEAPMAVRA